MSEKQELFKLVLEYEKKLDGASVTYIHDSDISHPPPRVTYPPKFSLTLKETIDKMRSLIVISSEEEVKNALDIVSQLNDQLLKFRNTNVEDDIMGYNAWEDESRLAGLEKESKKLLQALFTTLSGAGAYPGSEELQFVLPSEYFASDVTEIINLSYQEVLTAYQHECYISAISTCGKVIETVIGALYHRATGGDADAEKLGFDAVINRLRESGYDFKDSVLHQMKIIGEHRNKAVHGSIRTPTRDEARGVISFTKDVLLKAGSRELPESVSAE